MSTAMIVKLIDGFLALDSLIMQLGLNADELRAEREAAMIEGREFDSRRFIERARAATENM